ncbi:MAG: 1-deoxy-D-xylulose-5-phosphate synthase, partial [Clostridia bacterium]|nr:1-deoxy-D-xylulose-5-phosphate synthase [Clostridia bacterium]
QYQGITGFPNPKESEHDAFIAGHSSTSLALAAGMAAARDLAGRKNAVIAVIGDGALTGGMAFEALNYIGQTQEKLTIILNDNEMSISPNVGSLANYLSLLRIGSKYTKSKKELGNLLDKMPNIGKTMQKVAYRVKGSLKHLFLPGMFFEDLGYTYVGPVDGHNLVELLGVLSRVACLNQPVLVHVLTQKGRGFELAEKNPDKFHGIGPFDLITGQTAANPIPTYTQIFSQTLLELADKDENIVALTAAMPTGTGLEAFNQAFPHRFFDVGIAEQQGVTMAAAMADQGLKPVVAIYSTFLQRAYDQILHDVCLTSQPIVLAIDRAGLVGDDGPTHHGVFDLSYLRSMPNMILLAPRNENMLRKMLAAALQYGKGPVAIRYPRGQATGCRLEDPIPTLAWGKGEVLRSGRDVLLLAAGIMVERAEQAAELLAAEGIEAEIIDPCFIKPLDEDLILASAQRIGAIVTLEENVLSGGFGSAVLELLEQKQINCRVARMGFSDQFIEQGKRDFLLDKYGLSLANIVEKVKKLLKRGEI